jgi:hypothetical protein
MNAVGSVAKNRRVRLQQQLVIMLRATGSIEGAKQFWQRIKVDKRFGRKIGHYGFLMPEQQLQLNKVAFPECNFIEVDADRLKALLVWSDYIFRVFDTRARSRWLSLP